MATDTAGSPVTASEPVPTIHMPGHALEAFRQFERELATYRRELPRLVAEGQAGHFALIKGDEVLSTWETWGDANQAGLERFGLDELFCVQPIDARDEERLALLDAWKAAQRHL